VLTVLTAQGVNIVNMVLTRC